MKTLFINGSPKGKNSTSEKFISYFTTNISTDTYDILRIKQELFSYDINELYNYDTIIMVMPLYIHAMPGLVMRFIERLKPIKGKSIKVGFIIQYGFPEKMQASYVVRYLKNLAVRLNLNYIGTILRGEAVGIQYMPDEKFKTLFDNLIKLGTLYNQNHSFDSTISNDIAESGEIKGFKKMMFKLMYTFKLDDILMKSVFDSKKAYTKRFNKPLCK